MNDALGTKSFLCSHMANRPWQNKCRRDGARSIRHTLGDQLRASAQRSVERKGSRKTPPDSPGNPQHLRITQLPGVVVKLDAAMRTLHSHMIGWRQLGQDTVVSV